MQASFVFNIMDNKQSNRINSFFTPTCTPVIFCVNFFSFYLFTEQHKILLITQTLGFGICHMMLLFLFIWLLLKHVQRFFFSRVYSFIYFASFSIYFTSFHQYLFIYLAEQMYFSRTHFLQPSFFPRCSFSPFFC